MTPGPPAKEANVVNDLVETATGTLWLATWRGLGRRDPDGGFTFFTPEDGLADDAVKTLYLEEDGTLWAGTDGGGSTASETGRSRRSPPATASATTPSTPW